MTPPQRLGLTGFGLTALGSLFIIAAMWSHRDWCGYLGLLLWTPGIVLAVRYNLARRRTNRAKAAMTSRARAGADVRRR